MLGFYYQVEFAQAVFLLLFPMSIVAMINVKVARRLRRQELTLDTVSKTLHRCRLTTQGDRNVCHTGHFAVGHVSEPFDWCSGIKFGKARR